MTKHVISMAMLVALLLFGSSMADAKKKPEAPVMETFAANFAGPGAPSLTVAIQEFSTDDEVQELAQSYARGGEDSLRNAMGKNKKGYFKMASGETMRLRIIQDQPSGAGRRLLLVGEAPRAFSPEATAQANGPGPRVVEIGHRGYDYSDIQLQVDGQGNGKGVLIPYCSVVFNKQGKLAITPMYRQSNQLVNVHREK